MWKVHDLTYTSQQFQQQVQNHDASEGERYDGSREETSHPASGAGLTDTPKTSARLQVVISYMLIKMLF